MVAWNEIVCPGDDPVNCDNGGECEICLMLIDRADCPSGYGMSDCVATTEVGSMCESGGGATVDGGILHSDQCGTSGRANNCFGGFDVYVRVNCNKPPSSPAPPISPPQPPREPAPPHSPLPLPPPRPPPPRPPWAPGQAPDSNRVDGGGCISGHVSCHRITSPPPPGKESWMDGSGEAILAAVLSLIGALLLVGLIVFCIYRRNATRLALVDLAHARPEHPTPCSRRRKRRNQVATFQRSQEMQAFHARVSAAVAALPVRQWGEGDSIEMTAAAAAADPTTRRANECAVCLVSLKPGDVVRELSCRHTFHKTCIDNWLLADTRRAQQTVELEAPPSLPTCPLCKRVPIPLEAPRPSVPAN